MSDDLRVRMTGTWSGFKSMLQGAKAEAQKFSSELAKETGRGWRDTFNFSNLAKGAAGYLGFEAIKSSIESLIRRGTELRQISEEFDISTDSVQKWEKATGKAGVTFGRFTQALETLRQKRALAGQDFKNLEPFQRLGISREEVFGANNEQLLLKILQNPDRAAINQLLPRAARLQGAAKFFQGMVGSASPLSAEDIEQLHEIEQAMNGIKSKFTKWNADMGFGRLTIAFSHLLNGEGSEFFHNLALSSSILRGLGVVGGKSGTGENSRMLGPTAEGAAAALKAAGITPEQSDEDRINTAEAEAQAAKEAAEWKEKERQMSKALLEAERQNMSIGERKVSIEQELYNTKKRLRDLDIIGPLTKEQQIEKNRLEIQKQGLIHDLREGPIQFPIDNNGGLAGAQFWNGSGWKDFMKGQREMVYHIKRQANKRDSMEQ